MTTPVSLELDELDTLRPHERLTDAMLDNIPAPPAPDPVPADGKPRRTRPTTRAARAAATADKAPKAPRRDATSVQVAASVRGLHELGGAVVSMTGRPVTGALLSSSAKDAGEAWAELSKRYPAVARLFTGTGDAMIFVRLLMVYAPIITTAMSEAKDPAAAAGVASLLATLGPSFTTEDTPEASAA